MSFWQTLRDQTNDLKTGRQPFRVEGGQLQHYVWLPSYVTATTGQLQGNWMKYRGRPLGELGKYSPSRG